MTISIFDHLPLGDRDPGCADHSLCHRPQDRSSKMFHICLGSDPGGSTICNLGEKAETPCHPTPSLRGPRNERYALGPLGPVIINLGLRAWNGRRGVLGWRGSEGPGQRPALQTRKIIRFHTPPTHTHLHTLTPTHSLHKQRRPARPRQRGDGRPGPGGAEAFGQRLQAAGEGREGRTGWH